MPEELFPAHELPRNNTREKLPRLDTNPHLRELLLPHCRLQSGDIWTDPVAGHRVGVLDARDRSQLERLAGELAPPLSGTGETSPASEGDGGNDHSAPRGTDAAGPVQLVVADPPYNFAVGGKSSAALSSQNTEEYLDFSRTWVAAALNRCAGDAFFYVWLGADQNNGFQPLPEFMLMMREFPELHSRSLITVRNQRGYGTAHNWMAVRQELLCYRRGTPPFQVLYTDIPKILRGYYKDVGGKRTENQERGRSDTIRPGNVWVDIQQVFYRMEENVPGSYAQKPLKAIERIVASSSKPGDTVLDPFAHSGSTLIACERLGRRCLTSDIDPVFAEITIRRLERLRTTGKTGWQWENPFGDVDITNP